MMKMTADKNIKIKILSLTVLSLILITVLTVNTSFSYLVSNKSRINVYTIGKVDIEITEDKFPESSENRILAPGGRVNKNPKIKNTGINDEYVFMSITVPLYSVITVTPGHKLRETEKVRQEIFNLLSGSENRKTVSAAGFTAAYTGVFQYSPSWEFLYAEDDPEKAVHTYYFGYKSVLQPEGGNSTTTELFDELQLRSLLEGEVPDNAESSVTAAAYAVQAEELPDEYRPADSSDLTKEELSRIFTIYNNQEAIGQ